MSLSISSFAQESNQEDLLEMLDHYMVAKDALTQDDFETAHSHLFELSEEIVESKVRSLMARMK